MEKHWNKVLLSAGQIQRRIRGLGRQITSDYHHEELLLVAVLKGSFVFLGDLIRQIKSPLSVDFLEVASYGAGTTSSRRPKLVKDVTESLAGKTVLVVDDILDSGHTLQFVLNHLKKKKPKCIKTCVLLDRRDRREIPLKPDYLAFAIADHFVVGYGLDYQGGLRHLPFIATLSSVPHPALSRGARVKRRAR